MRSFLLPSHTDVHEFLVVFEVHGYKNTNIIFSTSILNSKTVQYSLEKKKIPNSIMPWKARIIKVRKCLVSHDF